MQIYKVTYRTYLLYENYRFSIGSCLICAENEEFAKKHVEEAFTDEDISAENDPVVCEAISVKLVPELLTTSTVTKIF